MQNRTCLIVALAAFPFASGALAGCDCAGPGDVADGSLADGAIIPIDARVSRDSGPRRDVGPRRDTSIPMDCSDLIATVRDFQGAHPDFQAYSGTEAYTGLVEEMLGADNKPVYAHTGSTPQTTGPDEYFQWYHDVAGVNEAFTVSLPLTDMGGGLFVFADDEFFPIDGRGFGDEGFTDGDDNPHNFHFTTEVHTNFIYEGGETFTFTGDDDLWLFINGHLAIDLGGLHPELSYTVDLDADAATLGITPGNTYRMDIFHAERHTTESNFRIETSIECFILI